MISRSGLPGFTPREIALSLILRIEPCARYQASGQTDRERGIIRPLPGPQPEGTTANQIINGLEAATRLELESRAEGITRCQSKQAAFGSIQRTDRRFPDRAWY